MADFIAELSPCLANEVSADPSAVPLEQAVRLSHPAHDEYITKRSIPSHRARIFTGHAWWLHVDGASNSHWAGAGVVLVTPDGILHEQALSLGWSTTNNEDEYESLIAGLRLAKGLGASEVQVYSDSQLVVSQLNDEYAATDELMNAYVNVVAALVKEFQTVAFDHVSRDLNFHADALAGLGAVCADSKGIRTIELGEVHRPSFEEPLRPLDGVMVLQVGPS